MSGVDSNSRALRLCLCAAAAAVLVWPIHAQQRAQFRSGADAVTVDVSVRDGSKVVSNLTADDFVVLDNGVRQQIADVSYGKVPIDITVAFDVSASIGPQLPRLRTALYELAAALPGQDRMRLLQFNQRVSRLEDFTNDKAAINHALAGLTARGGTSVFDALSIALVAADSSERRQLVVMFTDGADSASFTDADMLLDVAQRSTATVSAVLPSTASGVIRVNAPPLASEHRKIYNRLAADTGGVIVESQPREPLSKTFLKALEEFRTSYVLHFAPQGAAGKGFHTLTVTVPKLEKPVVRARRGYWVE